jgi:tetratricopeptide (TPR) repeat protein
MKKSMLTILILFIFVLNAQDKGKATVRSKHLIEPEISQDEAKLFDKIKQIKSPQAVILELKKVLKAESSAALDFALAVQYQKLSNHKSAIESLTVTLTKLPLFHRARYNRFQSYMKLDQYDTALKDIRNLLFSNYAHKESLYKAMGLCYMKTEKFEEAEYAFKTAIVIEPDLKLLRLGLLNAYLGQEKYRELGILAASLLKNDPYNAQLWNYQISASLNRENYKAALSEMEIAKRLNVLPEDYQIILADLYFSEGYSDLALDLYLLELNRQKPPFKKLLSALQSYIYSNDFGAAKELLNGLKESGKLSQEGKKEILLLSGQLLAASGDGAKALAYYRKLVKENPLNAEILMTTADLCKEQKLNGEAELYYKRVIKSGKKSKYLALLKLSQLYVEMNDYKRAVVELERAIEIEDKPSVRRYLKQIHLLIEE